MTQINSSDWMFDAASALKWPVVGRFLVISRLPNDTSTFLQDEHDHNGHSNT
jgi:hypothetical protein